MGSLVKTTDQVDTLIEFLDLRFESFDRNLLQKKALILDNIQSLCPNVEDTPGQ